MYNTNDRTESLNESVLNCFIFTHRRNAYNKYIAVDETRN